MSAHVSIGSTRAHLVLPLNLVQVQQRSQRVGGGGAPRLAVTALAALDLLAQLASAVAAVGADDEALQALNLPRRLGVRARPHAKRGEAAHFMPRVLHVALQLLLLLLHLCLLRTHALNLVRILRAPLPAQLLSQLCERASESAARRAAGCRQARTSLIWRFRRFIMVWSSMISFTCVRVRMDLARVANWSVVRDSSRKLSAGVMQQMMAVLVLPASVGCRMRVSLESRKLMWAVSPLPAASELMTRASVSSDLLMLPASRSRSPSCPATRQTAAKSESGREEVRGRQHAPRPCAEHSRTLPSPPGSTWPRGWRRPSRRRHRSQRRRHCCCSPYGPLPAGPLPHQPSQSPQRGARAARGFPPPA